MGNIGPCCYPGCKDVDGNPVLTTDVICARSRARYRWVLDDLAQYFALIRETMPEPVMTVASERGRSSERVYGHPSEWASEQLTKISDVFHGWEDNLREYRGDGLVTRATSETIRVEHGYRYLTNWFEVLCTFPAAGDAAVEFDELRRVVRLAVGAVRRCPCQQWAVEDVRTATWLGHVHHPNCAGTGQRKDTPFAQGGVIQ